MRKGYLYVDKTDLVWRLANYSKFVFLSRPRRFGKSLLSSTLESYFRGEKELFMGLKIMELEHDWTPYPTIRLDLSRTKGSTSSATLQDRLLDILDPYAEEYGITEKKRTPGAMLDYLIRKIHQQTSRQVAVIIDEYDAPLLDVLHSDDRLEDMRRVMQEFYVQLKASEAMLKYCFITGITKFSQLSIFSTINNLTNVTMDPQFGAICGITEQELTTFMSDDIKALADTYEVTPDEMLIS